MGMKVRVSDMTGKEKNYTDNKNKIRFEEPASEWEQVHPIGNGSLGAMIWGTKKEKLGLNLDTLWSGVARDTNNYHAREYLEPIRKMIFDGEYPKAAKLIEEHMLGEFGENYLPMGNLIIDVTKSVDDRCTSDINHNCDAREKSKINLKNHESLSDKNCHMQNYRRVLDLENAIVTVSYEEDGVSYEREYFASYPDHLIGMRFSSSEKMNLRFTFESELHPHVEKTKLEKTLIENSQVEKSQVENSQSEKIKTAKAKGGISMYGQCPEHVEPSYLQSDNPIIWGTKGIKFETRLSVIGTDGVVEYEENCKDSYRNIDAVTEEIDINLYTSKGEVTSEISSTDKQRKNTSLIVKNASYCNLVLQAASGSRQDPLVIPKIELPTEDVSQNNANNCQQNQNQHELCQQKLGQSNHSQQNQSQQNNSQQDYIQQAHREKIYEHIKADHIRDYQNLFERVKIDLGKPLDMPTDKRLALLKEGNNDPNLYALFFQYGRYLLISSSREGAEAANLQGIWNWQMRAPWSSNYTTNINVQMNYWPAQTCNLAECMKPYYTLLGELVENGKKTAQVHFGCRGFCVGHNTDFWRITNPVGVPYGKESGVDGSSLYAFFVLSGQWMCQELWKAYEYHGDLDFLNDFSYPILKEAVLFTIDWLVEYKGYYITCPSASPENQFRTEKGISPISMGTTMDMTIVREIFDEFEMAYLELEKHQKLSKQQLSEGKEILSQINKRRQKLPPYQIGEDGRLLEWFYPFEETEQGHRHISHAYGLFPGNEFRRDDKLKEGCKKSIEYRLSHGGGHTGWSCAWIANLFAVLGDGEKAYEYMKTLLTKSICDNLWTSHPPFQIDANFAGIMAMAQMFVQEEGENIKVLPAIPKEWKQGRIEGLSLRGNRTIDIIWGDQDIKYRVNSNFTTSKF